MSRSRRHKRRRIKKVGGVGVHIAGLTSDYIGYKLAVSDFWFVLLVGLGVMALGRYYHPQVHLYGCILGATFCAILYAIFKLLLPMVVFVRVGDLLRFRYGFYLVCAAGAFSVESSSVFWKTFSSVNVNSVTITLGAAVVLSNMIFMRYGGRLLLIGSYFVSGALCAFGVTGVITMVLAWATRYLMKYKLCHSFAVMMADPENDKMDYLIETKVILRNTGLSRHCRISSALMLMIGFGLGVFCQVADAGAGRSAAVVALFKSLMAEAKAMASMESMILVCAGAAMMVICLSFIRRATDVYERMGGQMMLIFAIVLGSALAWSAGIAEKLPPFSLVEANSLIPDVLVAYALVLASSVFIIELGCRELSALNSGFALSASPELLSRRTRNFRVLMFSITIALMVLVTPLMLH